jgi:hypothetical protein
MTNNYGAAEVCGLLIARLDGARAASTGLPEPRSIPTAPARAMRGRFPTDSDHGSRRPGHRTAMVRRVGVRGVSVRRSGRLTI